MRVEVIRQTEKSSSDAYTRYAKIFGYIVLSLLAITFGIAFWKGADTLPVWACYDTLLLISHLPLLNVNMPGPTVIFLTTLAKILSFEFIQLETAIID